MARERGRTLPFRPNGAPGAAGPRCSLAGGSGNETGALRSGDDDLGGHRYRPFERITDRRTRLRSLNDLAQLILSGVGRGQLDAHPDCAWTRMDGVIDSENAAEIGMER